MLDNTCFRTYRDEKPLSLPGEVIFETGLDVEVDFNRQMGQMSGDRGRKVRTCWVHAVVGNMEGEYMRRFSSTTYVVSMASHMLLQVSLSFHP